MARLAFLPCLEPSLVFWYDTQYGGRPVGCGVTPHAEEPL